MWEFLKKLRRAWFGGEGTEKPPQTVEQPVRGVKTAPLSEAQIRAATRTDRRLEPDQLICCSAISIGRERDHNEDALFCFSAVMAGEKHAINLGIFIIADGLGGHERGEVASRVAVQTVSSHLLKSFYSPFFGPDPKAPEESVQETLEAGIKLAHEAVKKAAPGGGTTLTAVLVFGHRMTIAQVGDSRAYAISSKGAVDLLTRDHTLVRRLEELGQITPEEAEVHPQRHDLYRALGLDVPAEPDTTTTQLPDSGHLLLCSDGLWDVVPAQDMARLVTSEKSLSQACIQLVEAANAAGGPDNISAILVQLPG